MSSTDRPTPLAVCPLCGGEQEDYDGFGVLYHEECGYCAHTAASIHEDGLWHCDVCGQIQEDDHAE